MVWNRPEQFKTLLTRVGRNCTVVVTGDPDQARVARHLSEAPILLPRDREADRMGVFPLAYTQVDTRGASGLVDFLRRFAGANDHAADGTAASSPGGRSSAWWRQPGVRRAGSITVVTLGVGDVRRHRVVSEVLHLYKQGKRKRGAAQAGDDDEADDDGAWQHASRRREGAQRGGKRRRRL